jgi:hypothetical protein
MQAYRAIWFFFMILVVFPAFISASYVEGLEFWEAQEVMISRLVSTWYYPTFLAHLLAMPITVVATILPGTSAALPLFGEMIWQGVGVIFTLLFMVFIEPPFASEKVDALS